MKNLKFILILLVTAILLLACTKSKNYTDASQADSLKILSQEKDEARAETNAITDTLLKENDPIWNESPQTSKKQEVKEDTLTLEVKDDWIYGIETDDDEEIFQGSGNFNRHRTQSRRIMSLHSNGSSSKSFSAEPATRTSLVNNSDGLGFSVGGAKDINNFRENIANNFMPLEEDISHEGLFYDYFFDNNITKEAKHLFEPSYTSSKSDNPLTGQKEIYLSIGLNSNLTQASFQRKKLNLTIVLDISGSMSSNFNDYYYNRLRRIKSRLDTDTEEDEDEYDNRSKMEIAKECIIALTKHLKDHDRLAVVLYDNSSYLAKPLNLVGNTDMEAIRNHINQITPQGGTNMYTGIKTATQLYDKLDNYDPQEYDNRIIFLTDAMPNTQVTDENTLWGLMKTNSEKKIYTSFIGVGVDLNNELISYITKTPGANYFSVHNAEEFKKRMDTQFDYMVTPLVFDLTLHLKSENYEIDEVYGSPEADMASGEIMRVNTLFPSETADGQTKGGIILIKLNKIGWRNDIELVCSYKDRNGIPETVSEKIQFSKSTKGTDNGIRKAILLSRYVNLMHDWINNKKPEESKQGLDDWQYGDNQQKANNQIKYGHGRWERRSKKLEISDYYKDQFSKFKLHFAKEATEINDEDLRQELDILEKLADEVSVQEENQADISIMPEYFWGNWDDASSGVWTFGIKKNNFRTGNEFYIYEKFSYNKSNETYMIKISKGNKDRTYYFRFENPRSMYYSRDNKTFKRVVKQ
jgi:Ca-activated chloride channel family protein